MRVVSVEAVPLSLDLRDRAVTLGVGTAIKKDTIIVRVRTEDGIVGYGEAHHALAPTVVAELVNTSLAPLVIGEDALAVEHVWEKLYFAQGRTHGPGWAIYKAISGIDIALWDARGKALGMPVWRLLGGKKRKLRAYAGGISLNYQAPESLAEEAQGYVAQGFTALKLRLGDSLERDLERVRHVRQALGDGVDVMVDVNTRYTYPDFLRAMPTFEECGLFWVEEPFPRRPARLRAGEPTDARPTRGRREPLPTLPGPPAPRIRGGPDPPAGRLQSRRDHRGQEDRRPGGRLPPPLRPAHLDEWHQRRGDPPPAGGLLERPDLRG